MAKQLISDCHSSFLLYSHFLFFFVFGLQEWVINETAVGPIQITAKRTHFPGFPFLQRKNQFLLSSATLSRFRDAKRTDGQIYEYSVCK